VPPRSDVISLIFWIVVADLVVCLVWARPLLPFLLVAVVAWWAAGAREGALARTARDVGRPVAIGITLVAASLLALNGAGGAIAPGRVHAAEDALARLRLILEVWTHLSLWRVLIVGSVVIALAAAVNRLDVVGRFEQARGALGFVQMLLRVLTSFVVYAQAPLQNVVGEAHARAADQYRAALEEEWRADARTVAARSLHQALPTLTGPERARLRTAVAAIDADRQVAAVAAAEVAAEMQSRGRLPLLSFWRPEPSLDGYRPLEQARIVDPMPRTPDGLEAQQRAARTRTSRAAAAESRQARATAAAIDTLVALAGLQLPVRQKELRILLEDLIDNAAKPLERRVARRFLARERTVDRHTKTTAAVALPSADLEPDAAVAAQAARTMGWLGHHTASRLQTDLDAARLDRGFARPTDPTLADQIDQQDHEIRDAAR
jgi:hypothetical protein